MKALYLSRLDNNLGDIQSSVYRFRKVFNNEIAKRKKRGEYELFPDGNQRDFAFPETWGSEGQTGQVGETKNETQGGYELIVVGGGGLIGPPIFDAGWDALSRTQAPIVLWGIGHNVHFGRKPSEAYTRFIESNPSRIFTAFRDTCAKDYVPCPSVHEPMLSQPATARNKMLFAAYLHSNQPSPLWSKFVPTIGNHDQDLNTVLNFLGSSALNVTNSYHGALWSRCLGRKTIVYKPFSDKFHCIPQPTRISGARRAKASNLSYLEQLREASFLKAMDLADWLSALKS